MYCLTVWRSSERCTKFLFVMSKRRIKPRTFEDPGTPTKFGDDPSYPIEPVLPRKPNEDIISWMAWWLSQFGQPNGSDNPNSRGGSGDPNTRGYDDGSSSGSRGGSGDPNNRGFGDGDPVIRGGTGAQPSTTTWAQWLQNLGLYDQYASLLAGFGFDLNASPTDAQMSDWQKQLMDMILQHIADQENRDYTRSVLEEQRNYDSPLSQLFRLTGAGIGRDAAIQALTGVQQPTVGAQATIPQGIMPSESAANDLNNKLGIANAVFNAFGSVASLVSLGFSIPQAIQQTKALRTANLMTQNQQTSYNAATSAFNVLRSAGAAAESFGSVSAAIPAIQQLAQNGDVNASKFIQDGGVEKMGIDSAYASKVLSGLYKDERSTSDYSKQMENYFKQQDLQTDLMSIDREKGYIDINRMLNELLISDEQLNLMRQQYERGELEVKILGQTFKLNAMHLEEQEVQHDIYMDTMTTSPDGEGQPGKTYVTLATYNELYNHWRNLAILDSPENREKYEQFLKDNHEAAWLAATIDVSQKRQIAWQWDDNRSPDAISTWTRFSNIFTNTGGDKLVSAGFGAARLGFEGVNYLTRPSQFVPLK